MTMNSDCWYGTVGYSDSDSSAYLIVRVEKLENDRFPNHNKRILRTKTYFPDSSSIIKYLADLDIVYTQFVREYETHPIWEPIP